MRKFGTGQLESLISIKDYFSFSLKFLLGFGILFQLPLVVYLLSLVTPITAKILLKCFKYVITISFIIAAILTPTPDFFNQTIMAVPLIVLYLVTVLILFVKQASVRSHDHVN
jgi:sec-independent protein translocase protein TatC